MTKKEQLQQELTRLNRLRKNVKKELKNLDGFAKKRSRESIKAEIEEILIKEAKQRYKVGDVIKCLDGVESEVIGTDFVFNNNDLFLNGERVEGGDWFNTSAKVFEKGQWATIIEKDKFAELKEAHRNGAEIEIKCSDGVWRWAVNPSWNERNEYRIKREEKPKVGDVCKFWDSDEDIYIVGILDAVESGAFPCRMRRGATWGNARAITKEEAIELLYGHK